MAKNKKTELIQIAHKILQAEGPDNITIRRLASEAGCTSTVIYKHFNDLEHLLAFASIQFLKDYIRDFGGILNSKTNALDILLQTWACFTEYAFRDIPVYEALFFGRYKESLSEIMYEYYRLFPDELKDFGGLAATVFFNNDLNERIYILLRRAASSGYLLLEDAVMLSDLQCFTFHGLLLEYKDKYKEPGKAEEGAKRFMNVLNGTMEKYRLK